MYVIFKREDSRFRFSDAPMRRAARDPKGPGSSSSVQWEKKSVGGDAMGVAIGCESEYKGDYVSQRIGAPAKHKKDRGVALNQYRQGTSVAGGLEEVKNAPAPRCRWPSSCARVKDTGNRNVCTYHYPCDGRHPLSRVQESRGSRTISI